MIEKTQVASTGICESLLCIIGVTGGTVAFLSPFLLLYYCDTVGTATITVIDLLVARWFIHRYMPTLRIMLVRPALKWWLLAHASLPYGILCGWEWLQSTGAVAGVYDRHDYLAFTGGYALTLALLTGAYRRARRNGDPASLLW